MYKLILDSGFEFNEHDRPHGHQELTQQSLHAWLNQNSNESSHDKLNTNKVYKLSR